MRLQDLGNFHALNKKEHFALANTYMSMWLSYIVVQTRNHLYIEIKYNSRGK